MDKKALSERNICTKFIPPALERANNVKKRNYFTKYGETAHNVLDALLDKYAIKELEAELYREVI